MRIGEVTVRIPMIQQQTALKGKGRKRRPARCNNTMIVKQPYLWVHMAGTLNFHFTREGNEKVLCSR
jgi:hypothetical protein